jgi:hypothetical protein
VALALRRAKIYLQTSAHQRLEQELRLAVKFRAASSPITFPRCWMDLSPC